MIQKQSDCYNLDLQIIAANLFVSNYIDSLEKQKGAFLLFGNFKENAEYEEEFCFNFNDPNEYTLDDNKLTINDNYYYHMTLISVSF